MISVEANERSTGVAAKTTGSILLAAVCAFGALVYSGSEFYCFFWPSISTKQASGFSYKSFEKVEAGMTRDQVVGLLGEPLNRRTYPRSSATIKLQGDELWAYTGEKAALWGDWAWLSRQVVFSQGKVVQRIYRTNYD